ncbi:MAG: zinc ribbon domain-containing protein [Candidatus Thorarchaeota archaeon]
MSKTEEEFSHKRIILRSLVLILYLFIIFFLFYILTVFKTNPLVIFLIVGFVLLVLLGTIFRSRKSRKLYSKLFPNKKQKRNQQFYRREEFRLNEVPRPKRLADISLDFKYRKALINKCENCGITLTSFVKNCPNCGSRIKSKNIVKKCENCGMLIPRSVKICPVCGTPN